MAESGRSDTLPGDDARGNAKHTLAFRALYHDREEISGYCARVG